MSAILAKTARTFYVCNKRDVPIIRFKIIFLPKRYIVINTELLQPEANKILEIEDQIPEDVCDKVIYLNEKLSQYLHKQQRDFHVSGYLLDDFIIEKLGLDQAVTNIGRLQGMEYLIDLLQYHFYDKTNELYVTCRDPGIIAFFHEVPGWKRLLFDFPVVYADTKNNTTEEYDYVSVS